MEQPRDGGAVTDSNGRFAENPWKIPAEGWKAVLRRSWSEAGEDNIGIVAAGVSFYGFLALVPLLGAVVLTYGLVAEPRTVIHDVQAMTSVMPADAAKLIGEQLMHLVKSSDGKKGLGVLVALAIALFGARNGAGSVITALNIAYEEKDERGFVRVNLLALAITGCTVIVALIGIVAIAALGHLESLLPFSSRLIVAGGKVLAYVALTLVAAAGAAALYRFGPARRKPRWIWLTPGSVLTAVLWLLLTLDFGLYVARFGNYDASYGSLGAVVVMLTWLYLSSYVLLFGAELNSELEKQTVMDTTEGLPDRWGRGAPGLRIMSYRTRRTGPSPALPMFRHRRRSLSRRRGEAPSAFASSVHGRSAYYRRSWQRADLLPCVGVGQRQRRSPFWVPRPHCPGSRELAIRKRLGGPGRSHQEIQTATRQPGRKTRRSACDGGRGRVARWLSAQLASCLGAAS